MDDAAIIAKSWELFRGSLGHGKVTIQTLRLSMTPAIALMRFSGYELPSNKLVNGYLKKSPGQRASLTGFITFLRKEYNLEIDIPAKSSFAATRSNQLERQLVALMHKEWSETEYLYWCKYSLEFFHGLLVSMKTVRKLFKEIKMTDSGCTVTHKGECYFLPLAIVARS